MRPRALPPRRDVAQVVREVDAVQLVVDELADVPGEVVVPGEEGRKERRRRRVDMVRTRVSKLALLTT